MSSAPTHRYARNRGFTLVEMIVSLGIFAVVAVVASAALLRIVSSNARAQSIQLATNTVSYALDTISRELRTANNFDCETNRTNPANVVWSTNTVTPHACNMTSSSQNTVLAFVSSQGDPANPSCGLIYVYRFTAPTSNADASISKAQQTACNQTLGDANYYSVIDIGNTVNNVRLSDFRLSVQPSSSGYDWATIRLMGIVGLRAKEQSTFDVETSVSQRTHD